LLNTHMNAAEIIRNLLTVIDTPKDEPEAHLANSPNEHVIDAETIFSMGDDVHKPKNPADIRTNAPSMYPGHQAEKK
jgi:hypothetical protein